MYNPNKNVYWYVLFTRTGSEDRLASILTQMLKNDDCKIFIPKKQLIYRRGGKKELFSKICFPGYIFIESYKSPNDFMANIVPMVYKHNNSYYFLYYTEKSDIAMHEDERIALTKIIGNDYCINMSKAFKEGDSIKITQGPLIGFEGSISKINKKQNIAIVNINMFCTTIPVTVGMHIIDNNAKYNLQKSMLLTINSYNLL